MAPNVITDCFPPKLLKPFGKAIDSATERTGFPPKPLTKSTNSVIERSNFSPEKLVTQLVFTKFGLSPLIPMPSPELSFSQAKAYTSPFLSPRISFPLVKVESPKSHPEANIKENIVTWRRCKQCRCIKSKCLKLYCECFASGAYCDGCNCHGCRNNVQNEALRQAAVQSVLARYPNAFKPKIVSNPFSAQDSQVDAKDVLMLGKRNRGCHCKKTECIKRYCECFQAKAFCNENCKCVDCKNSETCLESMNLFEKDYNSTKICNNFEGCEDRMTVSGGDNSENNSCKIFHGCEDRVAVSAGDNSNTNVYKHFEVYKDKMAVLETKKRKIRIQQANAAVDSAIGLSGHSFLQASRKSKIQEFLDSNDKDPPIPRLSTNDEKVHSLRFSGPLSALTFDSTGDVVSSARQSSSMFGCRSLLEDVIHPQDTEELCSILVLVSEAAKILADKDGTSDTQAVRENQTTNVLQVQDTKNCHNEPHVQKEALDDRLSGNQVDARDIDNFISGDIDVIEGKPLSPGKVALMCKEKDQLFIEASKPGEILNYGCNEDVYVEQERLVLESFRDCLTKLIALGNMKGNMVGQCQRVENPIVEAGIAM